MNKTLQSAGLSISTPQQRFFDRNGKEIKYLTLNTGAVVYPVAYDEKNQTLIFSTEDNEENRAKYGRSKNPLSLREKSGIDSDTNKYIQDIRNTDKLAITIKCPATVDKNTGEIKLSKSTTELAQSRSLMHIVDKKKATENDDKNAIEQKKKEGETPWYKNWKVWAIILLTVGLATIGVLGFRKGGWWNKDKKKTQKTHSSTPTSLSGLPSSPQSTPNNQENQSTPSQQTPTQPAPTQPAPTQPAPTQPAPTQPAPETPTPSISIPGVPIAPPTSQPINTDTRGKSR